MDTLDKIISLLYDENGSLGVSRRGMYGLEKRIFRIGAEHYIKTGENVLGEYDSLVYLSWRTTGCNNLDEDDVLLYKKAINNKTFWDIYSIYNTEEIVKIGGYVYEKELEIEYQKTYESRRKQAQIFISNKRNRDFIFNRDGKFCRYCLKDTSLSIDHIIPVSKGGDNSFENMQVLCRSCNSKKSNNI